MVLRLMLSCLMVIAMLAPLAGQAQSELEINTPAIAAIKQSMQQRHAKLAPLYEQGAIGLNPRGEIEVRDAGQVSLAMRGSLNQLVAAENADRGALYREIARANGHPEWEADIRARFADRWISRAPAGWWVKQGNNWIRK